MASHQYENSHLNYYSDNVPHQHVNNTPGNYIAQDTVLNQNLTNVSHCPTLEASLIVQAGGMKQRPVVTSSVSRAQPMHQIDADLDQYLRETGEYLRKLTSTNMNAIEMEKRKRAEYSDEYRRLYFQHCQTVTELNNTTSKVESLSRQINQGNETLLIYKSTVEDYEKRLRANYEPRQTKILEARIKSLEMEKADIAQKQGSALSNAADRISAAERKVDQLLTEKDLMAQAYETSLNNAVSRADAAERKMVELEQESALALAITAELNGEEEGLGEYSQPDTGRLSEPSQGIQSPTSEKRSRPENEIQISPEEQEGVSKSRRRRR